MTLDCSQNELSTLDLRKNILLNTLNCSSNENLTKICVNSSQEKKHKWIWVKDKTSKYSIDCN